MGASVSLADDPSPSNTFQLTPKLVPLETDLPKMVFPGRGPLKLRNLEPVETRQKPLMVPPGLQNVAFRKPVTSSDSEASATRLATITDGDKQAAESPRPSGEVELYKGLQWVQIDLEANFELHGIWVWHSYSKVRAYIDVIVQISNDPSFSDGREITLYNSDDDGSSGLGMGTDPTYMETNLGRVIDAKANQARYVRLYTNGNTRNEHNHYLEVEVWGRRPPAEARR